MILKKKIRVKTIMDSLACTTFPSLHVGESLVLKFRESMALLCTFAHSG